MNEYTFVLNLKDASTSTYQTWVTVRVRPTISGTILERKSNEGGNGQTWKLFGYGNPGEYKLFATNADETQAARIVAHIVRKVGLRCNVNGYGAAWRNATVVEAVVNKGTGRKLTAAPSIRLGYPDRDKNRNVAVETARRMAARLMVFGETQLKRNTKSDTVIRIDPRTLRTA